MRMPLNMKRLFVLTALFSLGFVNGGCEDKGQATLASAQSCLDAAGSTAQANACAAQVQNDHSADAYLIRCSANFIAQGVTGDRLATAYKQMSSSTASNKTTALMAYMIFDDSLVGNSSTETTLNCQLSGVASMYQLASAAALATTVANMSNLLTSIPGAVPLSELLPGPGGTVDPTKLQDEIAAIQADLGSGSTSSNMPAVETSIGAAVLNASDALCSSSSAFSSQDVCSRISSSIGTSTDPLTVGQKLLALLQAGAPTP